MKFVSLFLGLALSASAFARGGEGVGGGAGVVKNGQYMTFYSAGLYVQPVSEGQSINQQIPALDGLFDYISKQYYMSQDAKGAYLQAILPTSNRQYRIASPEELTPEIYARLQSEFKRVTNVDPGDIQLFAITDIPQKITYILPGFEKLTRDDQMAILFHEAYWLVHTDASYNDIVAAEMAFEATIKHPSDIGIEMDFLAKIGQSVQIQSALIAREVTSGVLTGFLDKNGAFTVEALFGTEFINCMGSDQSNNNLSSCRPYLRRHISDLIAKHPRSLFVRALAQQYDNNNQIPNIGLDGYRNSYNDVRSCKMSMKTVAKLGKIQNRTLEYHSELLGMAGYHSGDTFVSSDYCTQKQIVLSMDVK